VRGWPKTLAWSDFRAVPNPGPGQLVALNGHPIVARVAISILFYQGGSGTVREGSEVRFGSVNVRVQLDSQQMQYVPSRIPRGQEAYYLRHEQGHMDLMGLFARELELNLLRLRSPTSANLLRQANATTDEAVRSARMYAINVPGMDCMYDRETHHGMNRSQQTAWNRRIEQNLARWRLQDFLFRS